MSIIPSNAQPGAMWVFYWLTFSIFADKVVLGAATVVIPLEQETTFVRWRRGLVVQNHTYFTVTWWLIRRPVPTANNVHKFRLESYSNYKFTLLHTQLFFKFKFLIHHLLQRNADSFSLTPASLNQGRKWLQIFFTNISFYCAASLGITHNILTDALI